MRNSLFACNEAAASGDFRFFDGAAIGVGAATAAISWSTVTRNPIGTGISTASNGAATIEDSIVFFNNGDGTQLAGNPVVSYSNVQGGAPGDGNISLNPVFSGVGCDPSELVIVAGSPCIDAGNPDPTQDDACFPPSRGSVRSDMGAHGGPGACDWVPYEVQNLRFTSPVDLVWAKSRITNIYSLYRGTLTGGPWQYDHECLYAALSTPSAEDNELPAVGFYYLVSARDATGESTLGESVIPRDRCGGSAVTARTPRPRINTCP